MIKIFCDEKVPDGFKGKLLVLSKEPEYITPNHYQYLRTAKNCDRSCLDWTLVEEFWGEIRTRKDK